MQDLGLIDCESPGVTGLQARRRGDRTVEVGDQSGDPIGVEVRAVGEGLQDGDPLDRDA